MSDNPQRRNRIVINLEEPGSAKGKPGSSSQYYSGQRPRRSGAGKALGIFGLVVLGVVVAVAVGGFVWWQGYKSKPAYSLALLVDAVQKNDMKTVDTLVDTDKISSDLAQQVANDKAGTLSSLIPESVMKQAQSLLPSMMPNVKQKVHDEVVRQVKELSARAEGKPFMLVAIGMPWAVAINQTGDTAKAALQLKDRPVELTMQRDKDIWKIVGVKDDQLTQRITQSVTADVPGLGSQQNSGKDTSKDKDPGKQSNRNTGRGKIQLPQVALPGSSNQQ